MRFQLVGSHMCPNTLYAIIKCKEAGAAFSFLDISSSLADLKQFLALHEHDEIYENFREMSGKENYMEQGRVGLPCFIFEDGFKTLDLDTALRKAKTI